MKKITVLLLALAALLTLAACGNSGSGENTAEVYGYEYYVGVWRYAGDENCYVISNDNTWELYNADMTAENSGSCAVENNKLELTDVSGEHHNGFKYSSYGELTDDSGNTLYISELSGGSENGDGTADDEKTNAFCGKWYISANLNEASIIFSGDESYEILGGDKNVRSSGTYSIDSNGAARLYDTDDGEIGYAEISDFGSMEFTVTSDSQGDLFPEYSGLYFYPEEDCQ